MRKKVCVIGHFGGDKVFLDGQTIKTKIVTTELKKQLGEHQVNTIDTYGGKEALLKCFFKTFMALKNNDNVIMLPAHNGVRFFAPVLCFWNVFFNRKLHYAVIGGWLPKLLQKKKILRAILKHFDHIYVETKTMKSSLEMQGFKNILVVPNCKELNVLSEDRLVYTNDEPYRLCTFSRVNRLKGIEDAIDTITKINTHFGRRVYELDIYGRIDDGEEEWFKNLMNESMDYIKYCGKVEFNQSVEVIKNYFALLFPTKYYTEGIPGTIIDAYSAGVPVISSKWESFSDIVDEGVTGIGYEFDDKEDLYNKLLSILNSLDEFNALKINCIKKSERYLPKTVIKAIVNNIYAGAEQQNGD